MTDDDNLDANMRKKSMEHPYSLAATIYDYIDEDGDLLSVDIVNEEYLAFSIQRRGQDAVLTAVFDDTTDVRQMVAKILEWADDIDEVKSMRPDGKAPSDPAVNDTGE